MLRRLQDVKKQLAQANTRELDFTFTAGVIEGQLDLRGA